MDAQLSAAIDREIAWAKAKWGETKDLGTFLMVLEEEVREAKYAYIKREEGGLGVLKELLQVAAVAVNAAQQHGWAERLEVV